VPVGQFGWGSNTVPALNSNYVGDSLMTVGMDVGYSITPSLKASIGYYYQDGDLNTADASGVQLKADYIIANGLTVGSKLSYDPAYNAAASANLKYRFGSNGYRSPNKRSQLSVMSRVIQALSITPANRDVRVHDLSLQGDRDIQTELRITLQEITTVRP
jgi:nucleoside-specific outer membrane channel protein Tsx